MEVRIGTSGYGYRQWKGTFYPENIAAGEMLSFYSARFKTVEINNTFYQMPRKAVLASWSEHVPADFVFAFKAPQAVTHLKRLMNVGAKLSFFFSSLSVLGRKLGPVLFQFPKSFKADEALLEEFLGLIPEAVPCSFDFRSETWLTDRILAALHDRGCSLCIEETDEARTGDVVSTTTWGYLRLRRSDYSDEDLSDWMRRILSQNWEKVFVFFKHEEEAKGTAMAQRLQGLFGLLVGKERAS